MKKKEVNAYRALSDDVGKGGILLEITAAFQPWREVPRLIKALITFSGAISAHKVKVFQRNAETSGS